MNQNSPIKIFIAYARLDTPYLQALRKYLKPLERKKTIKVWYDGVIAPGEKWEQAIKNNLQAAEIILLLVSVESLYSEYFYDKEMKDALKRDKEGTAIVIPIILDHCLWDETELHKLQALPKDGKAVEDWDRPALAYTNIVRGILQRIRLKKAKEKAAIEERLQEEIEVKRKLEEERERKKLEAQKQAEGLQKYKSLLQSAETAHQAKNWKIALSHYQKAATFKTSRQIEERIEGIKESLKEAERFQKEAKVKRKLEEEKLREAQKQAEGLQKYKSLLESAQKAYESKNWKIALNQYQKAANFKTNPQIEKRIEAIQKPLKEERLQREREAKRKLEEEKLKEAQKQAKRLQNHKSLLESAQKTYEAKNWKTALNQYQKAANFKTNPQIEKRIEAIQKSLKEERFSKLDPQIQKIFQDMVFIEGGDFQMGSNEFKDQKPIHPVTIPNFNMAKYPVTQAQWVVVMGSNPCYFRGCDDCPVEMVTWNGCKEFIQKLNELTDKKFRLPSEAEWEFAARGGKESKGFRYAGSDNIEEVAWYNGNSGEKTYPVGGKKANELGLYDMSGNVFEWCEDDWHGTYDDAPKDGSAWIESERTNYRVLRGGSWFYDTDICCVSCRYREKSWSGDAIHGFRLVEDF